MTCFVRVGDFLFFSASFSNVPERNQLGRSLRRFFPDDDVVFVLDDEIETEVVF
jgi:hypothetical protein